MLINKPNMDIFFTNTDLRFKQAYDGTKIYWPEWGMLTPSSRRQNLYAWTAQVQSMREWVGPKLFKNIQGRTFQVVNKKYEDSIAISRPDVEDDELQAFVTAVQGLGQAGAQWPDQLMAAALEGGITNLAYDGQPFFHNAHPVDVDTAATGTYQNRFDSSASGGGVGRPLNASNYGFVRSAIMNYRGEGNRPLAIVPDILVVPPSLEPHAKQILELDLIAQAVGGNVAQAQSSTYKGSATYQVNPYLTSTTRWYLLCRNRPVRPIVWQLRKAPVFTARVALTDSNVFELDEFQYSVDGRGVATYSLPFLGATGDV